MIILFLTYYGGIYWFVVVKVITNEESMNFDSPEDGHSPHFHQGYFFDNTKYSIKDEKNITKCLIAMYYSLTTLTTTGMGDYGPVTNSERLVWSIFMVILVCCFALLLFAF